MLPSFVRIQEGSRKDGLYNNEKAPLYDLCNGHHHALTQSQCITECDRYASSWFSCSLSEMRNCSAGLSISYSIIVENVKLLSKKEVNQLGKVIRE
jgi:hypothetical protein